MNVKEIIQAWLKTNGYDGLYHDYLECGCTIDDLMPCNSCLDECEPGYDLGEGMIGRRQGINKGQN